MLVSLDGLIKNLPANYGHVQLGRQSRYFGTTWVRVFESDSPSVHAQRQSIQGNDHQPGGSQR